MKGIIFLLLSTLAFGDDTKGLQVQGSCHIKVVPDRGSISFTAEYQHKNQQEAVKRTTAQMNNLTSEIQKLQLKDLEIKTTNYHVHPVREYENKAYVDKGIKANMTLEITTSEISRLSEAMLAASKIGIQNVSSMSTFLSLQKSQAEYLKCLDIATTDARKKAERLADRLNFSVGKVVSLIESPTPSGRDPFPEKNYLSKASLMEAAQVIIEPGLQNFSTNIQITFEIK